MRTKLSSVSLVHLIDWGNYMNARATSDLQGLKVVNIHEAKTHLSRLVEDAANGHSFIIAIAGKPMV